MARVSARTIVPGFPSSLKKAPELSNVFGGALLGLETAVKQGAAKAKAGREERQLQTQELRNAISILNNRNRQIAKQNKDILDATSDASQAAPLLTLPDVLKEIQQATSQAVPDTGGLGGASRLLGRDTTPVAPAFGGGRAIETRGLSTGQKFLGGALRGVADVAGAGGRLLGGQQGESQVRDIIGNLLANLPGVKGALTPAGPEVGTTTGQLPDTQEALDRLEDFDDADDFIEALSRQSQEFANTGERLEDVVDIDILFEAFRKKFGDAALRRLEDRLSGTA